MPVKVLRRRKKLMFKYACLNAISAIGLEQFDENYVQTEDVAEANAMVVRSAKLHEMEFSNNLLAIARAGAGVNNIPLERCAEQGIVVLNTPGANANAVKELVLAGMLMASRDLIGGIDWVQQNQDDPDIAKKVEKVKKQFAGYEIGGKKLGIIGLGAIGQLVANVATHLDMDVYGYDPYISIDAAWNLSRNIHHVKDVHEIYKNCDFITIHVPANEKTVGMVDRKAVESLKQGTVLLNFSRDTLIDENALVEALKNGKVSKYVTDFANTTVAGVKNVLIIPHLGASTKEAEDNCAINAVREIRDYLENGNIRNSVNFPDCNMGVCETAGRIAILHKNVVNMIRQFSKILAEDNINIADFTNKSKGEFAYTMIDLDTKPNDEIIRDLEAIPDVIRVRVIHGAN